MIVDDEKDDILEYHDFLARDDDYVPPPPTKYIFPKRYSTVEFKSFME